MDAPTEGVTEDTLTLKLIYRRQSVVVGTTDGKTSAARELGTNQQSRQQSRDKKAKQSFW